MFFVVVWLLKKALPFLLGRKGPGDGGLYSIEEKYGNTKNSHSVACHGGSEMRYAFFNMTSPYKIPTPTLLYVHENLLPHVRVRFGIDSYEYQLATDFIAHIAAEKNVRMGTLEEQLGSLYLQFFPPPGPFDVTIGFGRKGTIIAQLLNKRWGCFPNILRLEITRYEQEDGSHILKSKTDISIEEQIAKAGKFHSLAIVDDVLFTGFTAFSILNLLPRHACDCISLFFTRGMEVTRKSLEEKGHRAAVGVCLKGKIETDVSTISSMNLVAKGAIHTPTEGDISYAQRQEWVEAWFPARTKRILALAHAITDLVKSFEPSSESEETIV